MLLRYIAKRERGVVVAASARWRASQIYTRVCIRYYAPLIDSMSGPITG